MCKYSTSKGYRVSVRPNLPGRPETKSLGVPCACLRLDQPQH